MDGSALTRRGFLFGGLSLTAGRRRVGAFPSVRPEARGTRLILLGTGGGPGPIAGRAGPSLVVLIDGVPYLVDCGRGAAWRLIRSEISLGAISKIFITGRDPDRNADYDELSLLAWTSGRCTRIDAYGPPPAERMTKLSFDLDESDAARRLADEGRVPLRRLIHSHELSASGLVMEDERVKVTAVSVDCRPAGPSFAYRFDAADRSIVVSSGAATSEDLLKLARGANVLVHETLYPPAIERMIARDGQLSRRVEPILARHARAEDVGKLAAAAGVRTLVLSCLVPGDDPSITDEMWQAQASRFYRGEILVGKDLMEI